MLFRLLLHLLLLWAISGCSGNEKFADPRMKRPCSPGGCSEHQEIRKYRENASEFIDARNTILRDEQTAKTGGGTVLSPKEVAVNELLMKFKTAEMEQARNNSEGYPPATHFFHSRLAIEKSQVYLLIKRMPKGAILHAHEMALADVHGVITSLTYLPNCYMCFLPSTGQLRFHFWDSLPVNPECDWKLVNDLRQQSGNEEIFNAELYSNMTLLVDKPDEKYTSQDIVWKRFLELFQIMNGLYYSTVGFKALVYQGLMETHRDHVQYIEIRTLMSEVYGPNGTIHKQDWVLNAYDEVFREFVKETGGDFGGAKVIYTGVRAMDSDVIHSQIQQAIALKKKFPNTLAGFDLVGQEDPGHPLIYFLDDLLEPSQEGVDLPYFFHAGETSLSRYRSQGYASKDELIIGWFSQPIVKLSKDYQFLTLPQGPYLKESETNTNHHGKNWFDEDVGINLIDAILLNTSRIGHGYAITNHPKAMQLAREKGIAIEVNPISNQVLGLVKDLRNHPAASLMSEKFPLVISSDDPAFWGALPLSHDFYLAFMGLGGAWADLSTLKQLATDSIKYSAMTGTEKAHVMKLWSAKWETFLDETIKMYNLTV